MDNRMTRWLKAGGFALLIVSLAAFLPGCKGKTAEEAESAEAAPATEAVTLNSVKAILGAAMDDQSGVLDLSRDAGEFTLAYRYYDADRQDIDNDMAADLAPKIERLYRDIRTLDRVVFQISVNSETPGTWKPYVSFAMNRKTADEIEWSGLLSARFLASVLDLKRYE